VKVVDVSDPVRVNRTPDDVHVFLESGTVACEGFDVSKIELRLYTVDSTARGPYSLITAFVETNCGSVETTYDEGFRGSKPLASAVRLLTENLGLSALVLRLTMSLRQALDDADIDGPAA